MEKIWLSLECCDNDSSEHTNVTLEKSHRFLFLEYHSSYLRKVTKLADAFCTLFLGGGGEYARNWGPSSREKWISDTPYSLSSRRVICQQTVTWQEAERELRLFELCTKWGPGSSATRQQRAERALKCGLDVPLKTLEILNIIPELGRGEHAFKTLLPALKKHGYVKLSLIPRIKGMLSHLFRLPAVGEPSTRLLAEEWINRIPAAAIPQQMRKEDPLPRT